MKEHEPSRTEKVLWWAMVGGIVAAVLGVIREAADLALAGGLVTASAIGLKKIVYQRRG